MILDDLGQRELNQKKSWNSCVKMKDLLLAINMITFDRWKVFKYWSDCSIDILNQVKKLSSWNKMIDNIPDTSYVSFFLSLYATAIQ